MAKFIWRRMKMLWVSSATKAKNCLQEVGSWFWRTINKDCTKSIYVTICKIYQEQGIISSHDNKPVFTTNTTFALWKNGWCHRQIEQKKITLIFSLINQIKELINKPLVLSSWKNWKKHNHSQNNNCQNAVWRGFRNLSQERNQKPTNEWTF